MKNKSGGNATNTPQPAISTGPKGPAARGATQRVGKTTRQETEKSGGNRMGGAAAGNHASGGKKMPGASYDREQRI